MSRRKIESAEAAKVLHALAVRANLNLSRAERDALDLAISILQARAHDAEEEDI